MPKNETLLAAEKRGWRVIRQSKHLIIEYPPNGARMAIPNSPGDYRGIKNAISLMKRKEVDPRA